MFFGNIGRLGAGGRQADENLDRPNSNFDIAGIPTGSWEEESNSECCSLLSLHRNIIPSTIYSFFCPCLMWAQIVIRSQIPLLIALKNSFICLRRVSGYGFFFDIFVWGIAISAGLIAILTLIALNSYVKTFLGIIIFVLLGGLIYLVSHTRVAFKAKYLLPSTLPHGCEMWSYLLDILISIFCLPCSLAQMARHVFQYNRWDPPIGFYYQDPSALAPLEPLDINNIMDRPFRADEAGLAWTDSRRLPGARDNTGAAHRPRRDDDDDGHTAGAPIRAQAVVNTNINSINAPIYRSDGSRV